MPDGAQEIRDDGALRSPNPPETRLAPLGSEGLAPEPRAAGPFVVVGDAGGHALVVGGVTVLERALRALGKQGATEATVAAAPIPLRADLPVEVRWVDPETAPPDGATVVRGDEAGGVRVVDERSRREAEWALCLALAKSHQGLIDSLINWRFSMPVTRILSSTRVMPNHITFVSFAVGLAGSFVLLLNTHWAIALGGVLIQAQSILDSCDGELARLRFQGSKLGQWLDNVSDDVLDLTFVVCAGVAAGMPFLPFALATAAVRAVGQLIIYHEVYRLTGSGDVYAFRIWFQRGVETIDEVYDPKSPWTYLRALGRRDTYVFLWMVLCLFGKVSWVAVYGSVLGAFIGGIMVLHVFLRPALPRRAS